MEGSVENMKCASMPTFAAVVERNQFDMIAMQIGMLSAARYSGDMRQCLVT
jgi:hypothetical protein